jgi:hypothetical protein
MLGTPRMLVSPRKLTKQPIVQGKIFHTEIPLSTGLTTSIFMQQDLQQATHNTYYSFPQAPMLSTPLLLQKQITMATRISL